MSQVEHFFSLDVHLQIVDSYMADMHRTFLEISAIQFPGKQFLFSFRCNIVRIQVGRMCYVRLLLTRIHGISVSGIVKDYKRCTITHVSYSANDLELISATKPTCPKLHLYDILVIYYVIIGIDIVCFK